MMVDLCMADDLELSDFEECLLDFMDMKFSMEIGDNSAKEIGSALLKIRAQLVHSARSLGRLESEEL